MYTLVGQYDSPFLRRVAVTMHHYGFDYDRKVLSVFKNADQVAEINPLIKVPVLILPNGEKIFDSQMILDHLDEEAGPENSLTPAAGVERREVLRIITVAWGLAEKSVALSIDKNMHANAPSLQWRHRVRHQIKLCLEWLENAAGNNDGNWFQADQLTQADITTAAAIDHLRFRHSGELDWDRHRNLKARVDRTLELDAFKAVPLVEG